MRRLIVSNLMSLDGFFESPEKNVKWFPVDEEFFAYAKDMLGSTETLLFGRATYEHMAAYWPTAPADEIADKMNNLPKVVVSRTLEKAEWNNSTVIHGNVEEEIAKLKQKSGKEIVLLGSSVLASFLLQRGIIDEYRVILAPMLPHQGSPLFKDIKLPITLKARKSEAIEIRCRCAVLPNEINVRDILDNL